MAMNRGTIQGTIGVAVGLVFIVVALLGGASLFALYKSRNSVRITNFEMEENFEHFLKLQMALEQSLASYEIRVSRIDADAANLASAKEAKVEFERTVSHMRDEAKALGWRPILRDLMNKFEEMDTAGRALVASRDLRASEISARREVLSVKANATRRQIDRLRQAITAHNERELFGLLGWLAFLIVPLAILTPFIVLIAGWMTQERIGRDLRAFIRTLYNFSEQNDHTSENLRTASANLSSASSQQSAAVQQTVASIAQIRSMLSQTSSHVREVQSLAANVTDKTQEGSQIMIRMDAAMIAIEQSNLQLQSFEEIIGSIREKTQVINDIVFKTQLLSFNASIEAARAGQYGRGFAVVAEEVGKLAQLSGTASKEIDQILSDSQRRVGQIVETVEERVRDGKEVSGNALKRFTEIANQIISISDKINQVGEATFEQEGGVEQTAKAMDQMDETAMESKRAAEEILKIAEKARHLSNKIRESTEDFRVYVRGSGVTEKTGVVLESQPTSEAPSATSIDPTGPTEDPAVIDLVNRIANKASLVDRPAGPTTISSHITADDQTFKISSNRK